jgi:hypothetical protein
LHPFIAGAVAAYGVITAGLFLGQRRLLYRPDRRRPELGDLALLGVREAALATKDGLSLVSWYLPPPAGRAVVAYFHGNGGHIGYRAERLRRFAGAGCGVLLAEYRGYGGNLGKPSEAGLFADGAAALDFLESEGIERDRLVLWGESLGSGVAVHLAVSRQIGCLVLEAPFTSVAAAAQLHYPFVPAKPMVRDKFDSLSRIGRVAAPLLVLHGERDRVVPARMGRALLAAATAPKEGWFAPEAGHENLTQFGALEAALTFIDRQLARPSLQPVASS